MNKNVIRRSTYNSIGATILGGSILLPMIAHAQLEEVVVTAQKREESVQTIPIAMTAVSANGLEKSGISGTDELSMVIPNLQYSRQISSATPFIRGVGTKNSSAGEESSVSTYVDGVYYSSMVASVMEFNNIERVEVLRGPQGTLFGRNATGGLIHVITKNPAFEPSAKISVGAGSYDAFNTGFYGTAGLSERLAVDISLLFKKRDEGYGTNQFNGRERAGEEDRSLRSKLLFDVDDKTSIVMSALYADRESDVGIARQPAKGTVATGGGVYTGDFQDINSDWEPIVDSAQRVATFQLTHAFESVELIATSAYSELDAFTLLDQDSGPSHVVNFVVNERSKQLSQEFQFNSTGDGPLKWTAGLFFMSAESKNAPTQTTSANPAFNINMDTEQETTSYAAYAQGTYDLNDATALTLGLRWTMDEREFSGKTTSIGTGAPINPAMPVLNDDESWEEPTWRLAIDHQLNEEMLVFASYSRGFKSGVYNTLPVFGALPEPVDPEILDSYEVGFKGDFLDNSLRINGSAFYYEFDNLQMQQILGGAIFLFNVGDSEMQGAEIESTYFVTSNLDINVSASYLDTEYTDFQNGPVISPDTSDNIGNMVTTNSDLSGYELTRAPKYTYSVSTNYRHDVGVGELSLNLAYYYNDGFFWEPDNRTKQDSYDVLNAEVALTEYEDKWKVRVFARNLLDTEYSYYSQQSSFGDFVSAAPPKTFGISAEYSF